MIKVTNTRYEEGLTLVLVYPIWSCGMSGVGMGLRGGSKQINRSDMITDEDDADNVIKVTNTRYEEELTLVIV